MHHSFLDKYSDLESPIHALDARIKFIGIIFVAVLIATLPPNRFVAEGLFGVLLIAAWTIAKLPPIHLLKRLAIVSPFLLLIFANSLLMGNISHAQALAIFAKALLCVMTLSLLVSTTPFPSLLIAMQQLKLPEIFVSLMSFFYRFIYIIIDEFERMQIARKSRTFSKDLALSWKAQGWIVGQSFIRSHTRSEMVYFAMLSRGFGGQIVSYEINKNLSTREIFSALVAIGVFVLIRFGVTI